MSNSLSDDLSSPHLRSTRTLKSKREQEKAADLDYLAWREGRWWYDLYADSREPPPPRKPRGGRSSATR